MGFFYFIFFFFWWISSCLELELTFWIRGFRKNNERMTSGTLLQRFWRHDGLEFKKKKNLTLLYYSVNAAEWSLPCRLWRALQQKKKVWKWLPWSKEEPEPCCCPWCKNNPRTVFTVLQIGDLEFSHCVAKPTSQHSLQVHFKTFKPRGFLLLNN